MALDPREMMATALTQGVNPDARALNPDAVDENVDFQFGRRENDAYPYKSMYERIAPTQVAGMGDFIRSLFGSAAPAAHASTPLNVPVPKEFPTQDDVAFARKNDATYGDPNAGFFEPGKANIKMLPGKGMLSIADNKELRNKYLDKNPTSAVAPNVADDLYQAHLAAQRSPLAALGFDPRQLAVAPKDDPTKLSSFGLYYPKNDFMWSSQEKPTTPVHESMHRGMEQLIRDGSAPRVNMSEEMLVRALMQKYFGMAEKMNGARLGNEQIDMASEFVNAPKLKEVEDAAAALYKKRQRPMGPR